MNVLEETPEQKLKKYLTTLSAQKRQNMRKEVNNAAFDRLMEMADMFKPSTMGGPDSAEGNFCIMRLAEIRGWESHKACMYKGIDWKPQEAPEELTEHYQPASIPPEETE